MVIKKVKVKQKDPNEVTKLQIITSSEAGGITFGPHPKVEDRVKIPDKTVLEVLDAPIRGTGLSNPDYYFIADSKANGNFRRYFIKKEDVVAA
jgi:hypothetical protein